jgi:RNA polymerase sigma factor (sigma-70 family)
MPSHVSKRTALTTMPSHQQNLELFKLLETAKFHLAELSNKPPTDAEAILFWEKKSAAIVELLIKANQGLVNSIAKGLKDLLDKDELVHVGNIALAKVIEKFNPDLGNQLSTYAFQPIRGAMLRAINKNRIIGIPEAKIGQLLALKKTLARLRVEERCENGMMADAEPSADDLAWAMRLPVEDVRELLALEKKTTSLDGYINDTSDASPYDLIADTKAVAPTEEAELNDDMKLLQQAVNKLSERDADVFLSGGGLFGREKQSFEKIGNRHGFSRQRGQQIFDASKRAVEAFIRFEKAHCSGKIAKQRLGLDKNPSLAAVTTVAKFIPLPAKPYRLKMRAMEKNPNHHIWNNNGTWYCKFVLILANGERSVICNSLDTKDVEVARRKRDVLIRLYNEPAKPEAA